MTRDQLIAAIDEILPQTQCRQCGFSGCQPYAVAIAVGRAEINQCPPGGQVGIGKLARLLGISPKPLNTAFGVTKPRAAAFINEQACIGCTVCITACPVDAIVGAARQMHTIISGECTGCELCVAPCPMDCITMVPSELPAAGQPGVAQVTERGYQTEEAEKKAADRARERHLSRLKRLERDRREKGNQRTGKIGSRALQDNPENTATRVLSEKEKPDRKKAMIQAALERARAARARHSTVGMTSEDRTE